MVYLLIAAFAILAFDTYEEPADPTDSPKVRWRKSLPMFDKQEPLNPVEYTTNENEDP